MNTFILTALALCGEPDLVHKTPPDKYFDAIVMEKTEHWFEVKALVSGKTYKLYPERCLIDKPESQLNLINYNQIKAGQQLRVAVYIDYAPGQDGVKPENRKIDRYNCNAVVLWGVKLKGNTLPPEGKPLSD